MPFARSLTRPRSGPAPATDGERPAPAPLDPAAHARFGHSMGQVRLGASPVGGVGYDLMNAPLVFGDALGPSLMPNPFSEQQMSGGASGVDTIQTQVNADNQRSALDQWQMTQGVQTQTSGAPQDAAANRATAGQRAAQSIEQYIGS